MDLQGQIKNIAERVAQRMEYELVRIKLQTGQSSKLIIAINKPGGVNVGDCAKFSRELGAILEGEDVVPGRYTLEVSSPGIDLPVKGDK